MHPQPCTIVSRPLKMVCLGVESDLLDQSSSWKNVGPVACGGAVEGPASCMSISSWVYAASCDSNPVIGWSCVPVDRYSTALRGRGGALSILWARVGSRSYRTSSGGEKDQT